MISLASCYFVRKAPKGKPYLYENNMEIISNHLSNAEKNALKSRLLGQLDDSSVLKKKDKYLILHYKVKPPVYDSMSSILSAANMKASMSHIGYYNAKVEFKATRKNKQHPNRVYVTYTVYPGNPTTIDTVRYSLKKPGLQKIALDSKKETYLKKNDIITKSNVLMEVSRLVDSFRNNGYYKFTAAEIRVRGDTTIEALTTITDDPAEQLRLLTEAQQKRDSPQIKLALVLIPPSDSSKLKQFYVNRIFLLTDHQQNDNFYDTVTIHERRTRSGNFIERYHQRLFRTGFLTRMLALKPGDLFRQDAYYKTLSNFSKVGVWQSVNVELIEVPGDSSKVDLVIELIPYKKFGFQAAIEASYSASTSSSNIVSGNLFGITGNLSLLNRNLAKEGIRMTNNIRAGIELNNGTRGSKSQLINSNEVGFSNAIAVPRLMFPGIANFFLKKYKKQSAGETFINTDISYTNRLNLFNLQSANFSFAWNRTFRQKWGLTIRPLFIGFSNLFNETDSFKTILKENPYLQYSYNTAYVIGTGFGLARTFYKDKKSVGRSVENAVRFNVEESGLTWGLIIPVLDKYKRRYIKIDGELKHTVTYKKTALAMRFFAGAGVPLLGKDTNLTLPFFKQYYGGGSNSMRGWPVRGIGPGGKPLTPFSSNKTIFNDRTGDVQIEGNIEYRYDIARIIPNALTLRGAIFADIGNIWYMRNTKKDGTVDSAQFKFKNLWPQLGISAGTGLRLDFNYLVLRFDFGFRFKRPDLYYIHDGWKAPDIGFDDALKKLFTRGENSEYRKWRYENFNFTIGIGYSF